MATVFELSVAFVRGEGIMSAYG